MGLYVNTKPRVQSTIFKLQSYLGMLNFFELRGFTSFHLKTVRSEIDPFDIKSTPMGKSDEKCAIYFFLGTGNISSHISCQAPHKKWIKKALAN